MSRFLFFTLFVFISSFISSKSIDSLLIKLRGFNNNHAKIEFIYKSVSNKKTSKDELKKLNQVLDSFCISLTNEKEKGFAFLEKGKILSKNREFNDALVFLFKALKLGEKTNDKMNEAKTHFEIGKNFNELKDLPSAIKHFYSSLGLYQLLNDKKMVSDCHLMLGNVFKDLAKIDSSLAHHKINLEINTVLNDSSGIASAYNDIGLTYKRDNKYELALEYMLKALKIREKLHYERGIAGANINIGNTLKHLKRYKEAMPFFDKGIEVAQKSGNTDFYLNGIIGRAKNAKIAEDYKQSALDFGLYIELKDSLYKQELKNQLAELEVSYQSEKKDAEIILQQEQIKLKSEQNSKQKIMIFASIIALFMALIAVFFVFRSYKQNKQNTLELANKNHLIEQKNREITDSINYAKLIQQSLLASQEMLDRNLDHYFILYKPKDIVSGDFYWAAETDKGFLVACVDCTGHGVPGAFMSLIGKENLDKALSKTVDPGEILDELNKNVKKSLNQNSSSGNKDGMDAAIVRLQKDAKGNHEIVFAGANRPLFILKKDAGSIEEIKATKQAIGGFTTIDQKFMEHKIKVNKGDTIVIATDGFADQFGSEQNKKLTTRRFKELLVSTQTKSATEQKQTLEKFFITWKGQHEQLDDLLVIGITI